MKPIPSFATLGLSAVLVAPAAVMLPAFNLSVHAQDDKSANVPFEPRLVPRM